MKFIINTAVDPHFCVLFSVSGERIAYHEWLNHHSDGVELWSFLKDKQTNDFTFIGGVAGPGGFSSLRVAAGVLNSLSFSLGIPVYSVRADFWQRAFLINQFPANTPVVVLNSFGNAVWLQEDEELIRYELDIAVDKVRDRRVCCEWLPVLKKDYFHNVVEVDIKNTPEVLLEILSKVAPSGQFIADYEVPPV